MDEYDKGLDGIPEPTDASLEYSVDELRSLDRVMETWMERAGYLDPLVGPSVIDVRTWKAHRESVTDTPLFDYLLYNTIRDTGYFYAKRHGHDSLEEFVSAALEGEHMSSEENIAKTYQWLTDDVDAPQTPREWFDRTHVSTNASESSKNRSDRSVSGSDSEQVGLGSFANESNPESSASESSPSTLPEEWGPTMNHPIPHADQEAVTLPNGIDVRELAGTALTPTDLQDQTDDPDKLASYVHRDDAFDPEKWAEERGVLKAFPRGDPEPNYSDYSLQEPSNIHTEYDIETIPEDVPIDAEKADIKLANRFIRAAIREHGHHDSTRRALQDWASKLVRKNMPVNHEPSVDDPRKTAFGISVDEFATSSVDDWEKAEVILTWGKNEHPEALKETVEQYNDYLREQCEKQKDEEERRKRAREFEESPPETVGNWKRFEADKDDVEVAYHGTVNGTEEILAVYRIEDGSIDGEFDAFGTIPEWWEEADLARNCDVNRHIVTVRDGEEDPWRSTLEHMQTFDADPSPADDDQSTESAA